MTGSATRRPPTVSIVWWDLPDSGPTIDALRADLSDAVVGEWDRVPGLLLKVWIADRATNRWGALMVWAGDPPQVLPANRAAELIGRPPTRRERFTAAAFAPPSFHRQPKEPE